MKRTRNDTTSEQPRKYLKDQTSLRLPTDSDALAALRASAKERIADNTRSKTLDNLLAERKKNPDIRKQLLTRRAVLKKPEGTSSESVLPSELMKSINEAREDKALKKALAHPEGKSTSVVDTLRASRAAARALEKESSLKR